MKIHEDIFGNVPENFHCRVESTLNKLDNKEIKIMKKQKKFTAIKAVAAAVAAMMVLTIGIGAANNWDYTNVFGGLFGSTEIPHSIQPQVRAAVCPETGKTLPTPADMGIDLEVLGVAGNDKTFYMVIELKDYDIENDGDINLDLFKFNPVIGKAVLEPNYSGGGGIISEDENSITLSYQFNLTDMKLKKGWGSFSFYKSNDDYSQIVCFDVLIDYNFSSKADKKTFNVNQTSNMPTYIDNGEGFAPSSYEWGEGPTFPVLIKDVEITPISVLVTTDTDYSIMEVDRNSSIMIKFKNGDVWKGWCLGENGSGGHGGYHEIHKSSYFAIDFNTAIDLNNVYSVTVGDIELVL